MQKLLDKIPPKLLNAFPAIAFFAGFLWDSLTLGRVVATLDLWILSGYWLVSAIILAVLQKEWSPKWQERFTWVLQFLFGSLFSALVIVYFKSTGSFYTLLVVLFLVVLLVANEFLQNKYLKDSLTWGIFTLSGAMLLNFIVPHIFHEIGTLYFIISLVLSALPIIALWKFSKKEKNALFVPGAVLIGMLLGHMLDLLPPVPLVLKQSIICKNFEKVGREYTCLAPDQSLTTRLGISPYTIHHRKGEPIYVLSSVFAPSEIGASLEHRWWHYNDDTGHWEKKGIVTIRMVGGRESGWRFHTLKRQMDAGSWRVETAVKDGAVVGYVQFEVPAEEEPSDQVYTRAKLD